MLGDGKHLKIFLKQCSTSFHFESIIKYKKKSVELAFHLESSSAQKNEQLYNLLVESCDKELKNIEKEYKKHIKIELIKGKLEGGSEHWKHLGFNITIDFDDLGRVKFTAEKTSIIDRIAEIFAELIATLHSTIREKICPQR